MQMRSEKGKASGASTTEASVKTTPAIKQEELSMMNSTQVATSRAITVPFHGADLFVVEHNGQPYTPMKPIVTAIGLDWGSQFRKVAANETRWGIVNLTIPSAGGEQVMTCLPIRKTAAWLTTIEPGKVKNPEVRDRVIQYQNECDDVLWQYWNDGLAINPRKAYTVQPSDTLNESQQIALRAMLESNVKRLPHAKQVGAMVKGWSKLKAHFGVPYRQIPAGEFEEALSIIARHVSEWELVEEAPRSGQEPTIPELVAKMVEWVNAPNGYPVHLFVPVYEAVHARLQRAVDIPKVTLQDANRTHAAFDAATRAAAEVQRTVFNAVMHGDDNWKHQRLLLAFITDSAKTAPAYVESIEPGSFVSTWPRLTDSIRNGECLRSAPELLDMAVACMTRLQQRSQRGAPPAIAH